MTSFVRSLALAAALGLAGCAGANPAGTPNATSGEPLEATAPVVPAADLLGPHVLGIDASRYQGAINWADLGRQGIAFAYLKASEGETVRNAYFETHREGARAAGIRWGVYHFVRPEVSVDAQLALFLAATGGELGPLPPVLDVEVDGGLSPDSLRAHVTDFAARLEAATGRRPMIYAGASFYRDRLAPDLDGHPLWVAQYRDTLPEVGRPWTLWQFTDGAALRGVGNQPVSLSAFRGSLADLDAFSQVAP